MPLTQSPCFGTNIALILGMKLSVIFLLAATAAAFAQMPSKSEMEALSHETDAVLKSVTCQGLKDYIGKTAQNSVARYNALRVAKDLAGTSLGANASFAWYAVPPLSNIQRLADQFPIDGEACAPLSIVACRDEFEPASFVIYPFADAAKCTVTAGDLRTADGKVIKADKVDVKVVKIWYQDGNAWYSYFNDTGLKLCPELLLNDENLVKVDTEKKANFIRVNLKGGDEYIWVSEPADIDPGFNTRTEPVNDAATLQPVVLKAGEFKQFMVTVKVDKDAAPGLYTGSISLAADNGGKAQVPVRLRVLPYALPDPKTYYDLNADFYTMLYCVPPKEGYTGYNGGDRAQSDAKQFKRLKNQYDHNVRYPLYFGLWNGYAGLEFVENAIRQARDIGMKLDPFFEAYSCCGGANAESYYTIKRNAEIATQEFKRLLGHTNIYPAGGEEPGPSGVIAARNGWQLAHENNNLVMCNGQDRRYFCGYADDLRVGGGFASTREADFMHRIKGKIGNYAGPHTGPENPDYMRRMHGMNLYKKDYDMMYNYGYIEGDWNDLHSYCYRITLVYETKDGFIDTLPWEGMREGIDDIRYATLLQQLAEKAIAAGKQKNTEKYYTGRKALQYLACVNEEKCDLPAVRLEMIRHIMALDAILRK